MDGTRECPVPPQYLSNGVVSLWTPGPALCSRWGLGEETAGGLSFRPEEVYVFQSTGGSGLWERLMVIVGWGCEGPSCTFTSCCTGWAGGCRKLPVLCATNIAPRERRGEEERVKLLLMGSTVPSPAAPHPESHIRDTGTHWDSDNTRIFLTGGV